MSNAYYKVQDIQNGLVYDQRVFLYITDIGKRILKETVFIQFYGKTHSGWFDLCNGFSDTWQTCRSLGDFLWLPHLQDTTLWYTPKAYQDVDLPFSKGVAYVSASYINHLYQAYTWALKYPGIRFIVGGPVAAERLARKGQWHPVHFKVEGKLPDNLILTGQSMESMFHGPDFSGSDFSDPWQLELPADVPSDGRAYFSYTIGQPVLLV